MEEKQKKVPAKRIQLVDVVLERKGSELLSGRRVRSPEDAANIIRDFIGDSDRENAMYHNRCTNLFVQLCSNSITSFGMFIFGNRIMVNCNV